MLLTHALILPLASFGRTILSPLVTIGRTVLAEVSLTISTLLTDVGSVLTAMLGWLIDIFNTAVSSPIVLVFIVMALIGVAVGFAKKILHI